jgi:ATP-dependent Clp protease ATP-binding subunit ClpB
MTSNMGSHLLQETFEGLHNLEKSGTMNTVQLNRKREELMESTKNEVMSMLKQQIRPEFLNRIDEIIMFSPLNEDQIRDIVRMQVDGIIRMLSESGIQMRLTDDAIAFLGKAGFDPEFGARPVKRAIQRYLLNDLSKKILSGDVNKEHEIVVDATGEGLRFSN